MRVPSFARPGLFVQFGKRFRLHNPAGDGIVLPISISSAVPVHGRINRPCQMKKGFQPLRRG
jgi:hypothetical protein